VELELINGERFGDWEEYMRIKGQEDELLALLHSDLCLREALYPVTEAMLVPGLVLIYHLGKNTFGCHAIRTVASGFKYLPSTDIRGAVRAGKLFTLP